MKNKMLLLASVALFVALSCSKKTAPVSDETNIWKTGDAKELIDGIKSGHIDASSYDISATDRELFIYGAGREPLKIMPMPAGLFYLAVAPYLERTHLCSTHSVTGCRGELRSADIAVRLYDAQGKLLLADTYNTGSNGFIDLWLPRQLQNAKLEISYEGKLAQKTVTTNAGGKTCETTMQLLEV